MSHGIFLILYCKDYLSHSPSTLSYKSHSTRRTIYSFLTVFHSCHYATTFNFISQRRRYMIYTYYTQIFSCNHIPFSHVGTIILLSNCFKFVQKFHYSPIQNPGFTPHTKTGLIKVFYNLNFVDWITNLYFSRLYLQQSMFCSHLFFPYFLLLGPFRLLNQGVG